MGITNASPPKNYIPESGMPENHFEAFQEAAKSEGVVVVVRNTNTASTPLIKLGCPGKPMSLKFHTSDTTGVVTAGNPSEVAQARELGYFVVDRDLVARRTSRWGEKTETVALKIEHPFWRVEPGQIIDPETKKPFVGDYDLMGVFSPDNPGQNLVMVINNYQEVVDVISPIVRKFGKAVNAKLDRPRVLHGAQDQFGGFRKGATVFFPDGKAWYLPDEDAVKEFYDLVGRQPRTGKYYSFAPPPVSTDIPRIPGRNLARQSKTQRILSNQDLMAALGSALGVLAQWLGDLAVQRRVQEDLRTKRADQIRAILAQGQGVLIIIRMQEWRNADFNGMRARGLLGVYVEGGASQSAALHFWQNTPRIVQQPANGWMDYEHYLWIDPTF